MTDPIDDLSRFMKAAPRGGKYYKRVQSGTDAKGKPKYRYFYTKDDYEKHMSSKGEAPHVDGERTAAETRTQKGMKVAKEGFEGGLQDHEIRQAVIVATGMNKEAAGQLVLDMKRARSQDKVLRGKDAIARDWKEQLSLAPGHVKKRAARATKIGEKHGLTREQVFEALKPFGIAPPKPSWQDEEAAHVARTRERNAELERNPAPSFDEAKAEREAAAKRAEEKRRARMEAAQKTQKSTKETPMNKLMKSQMKGLGFDPEDEFETTLYKAMMDAKEDPLKKGLYQFSAYANDKTVILPDEYLGGYLDAFIEEAYEHESRECSHRGLRLHDGEEPSDYMARMVFNELLIYCTKNANLLRATKKMKATVAFVKARLAAMNLPSPNTSNEEANREAATAGYEESVIGLDKSLTQAVARDAEIELRKASVRPLAERGFTILEDDRGDPGELLSKAQRSTHAVLWGREEDRRFEVSKTEPIELQPVAPLSNRGQSRTQ